MKAKARILICLILSTATALQALDLKAFQDTKRGSTDVRIPKKM